MTTDQQVTHPPVTHPEPTPQSTPPAAPSSREKPAAGRTARRTLRLPPPKILAAAALVVVALELLVWQVGGVFWGGVIHGGLLILAGAALLIWLRWRNRRDARVLRAAVGAVRRSGVTPARVDGGGRLARLFGRKARTGAAGGAGRGGLLSRLTGGRRTGAPRTGGGRSGSGTGRSGGLLGRLGRTGSGRRTGSGTGRASGRTGGLLGRLGRGSRAAGMGRATSTGTASRRTGLRSALSRASAGGRSLLSRARTASAGRPKGSSPSGKAARKATPGAVAQFLRGVREGAQAKPQPKKPSPEPKPAEQPAPKPEPVKEKPQPPHQERLVKEAVKKVADATPAQVAAPIRGGTAVVGDINKVRAAADELAAALKDYDPESMHQLVREMPQFGEALNAISQGFRQVASRAESEWPVAAPVAEGLRSIAGDIKAGAGTAEETRGTIRRENETDIERGEAPRHGSVEVERKWNV